MQAGDNPRHFDDEVIRLRAALAAAERRTNRLREEVQAAERAKDEFLANLSHEVRTPMNAILGFCRMLMRDSLAPEQTKKLQYIHDAAECLLQHINNALNLSRLAAGELKLSQAAFEVDAVIRDVVIAVRNPAANKGLAIDYLVENDVPRRLVGDAQWLGQILSNLLSNALKFTESGEIHVRVSLDECQRELATIRLVVSDTGVGIAPDRQQVIFDAFAQADGSSTRRYGGLGLGLSICKQLVDLMGGQIGFRSRPGSGSSFWVTVPLRVGETPSDAADNRADTLPGRAGRFGQPEPGGRSDCERRQPRVLMADNDYLNRTLVEMLLGRAGCLIETATSVRDAFAMASRTRYDLVLLDLQLPEVDGASAIGRLRELTSGPNHRAAVVAFGTETLSASREPCTAWGADDVLTKPLSPDSLLAVVARILPGCLETGGLETRQAESGGRRVATRSTMPRSVRRNFESVCQALESRDFDRLEAAAGMLKSDLLTAAARSPADQAMRVQFAARSGDLGQATRAVERLQGLLTNVLSEPTRVLQMSGESL